MTFEAVSLGEPGIASVIAGQSPPSSAYNDSGLGLPFYQGKADFGLINPEPRIWCDAGHRFALAYDVLLSVRAPVGDLNIANEACAIGRGIAAIRAQELIDPLFLFFALKFVRPTLEARSTGSTFASVNKTTLEQLLIPKPELCEQRQIGHTLQCVLSCVVDEMALLSAASQLKGAAMRELLSRGLRGEEQKDSEIGPVPESWEVIPLGSLGRIGNGSTPKRSISSYWENGTYPWLTSSKVYDRDIERADQFVTEQALSECHLPKIQPGAILIAITGQGKTLGHCAVLKIEATTNQHVAYLATDLTRADPSFVRGYIETQYEYLRQVGGGGGSTKGALTCAFLRSLPIPLPSTLAEQQEISATLDAIDAKIELHKRKKAVLEELFRALLQKLMTGEIRVADLDLSALETKQELTA